MTRSLKLRIRVEERLYYPSSENKGTHQLCSYCTADLRFCFQIGKNPVFSWRGSYDKSEMEIILTELPFFSSPEPKAHNVSL